MSVGVVGLAGIAGMLVSGSQPNQLSPTRVQPDPERAAAGGVFVNPALHEPFGLTLIEAAAAGVPVVATCNGGPAEIVSTIGHGALVDPRDPAGIAKAIKGIIDDPARHAALSPCRPAGCGRL